MFLNNLHNLNPNHSTLKHFNSIQHISVLHQFLNIIDIIEHNQIIQIIPKHIFHHTIGLDS